MKQQFRPVTLQDVADRAGVSRGTASCVLNGTLTRSRASAETQERVRLAAVELGYGPNAVARSLFHHKTNIIGFYNAFGYIDARNPFLSAVIAGMHAGCDSHAYNLLIHRVGGHSDPMKTFLEITSGMVDGIILYTQEGDAVVDLIAERGFPAVALADAQPQVPSVTADDPGGSRQVAEYLAKQGHRRVLYRMPSVGRASANVRRDAFLSAARELGLHVDVGVSVNFEGVVSRPEIELLNAPQDTRPTAIACWADGSAMYMLDYLNSINRAHDFAVIGFDGFDLPHMPAKLTTVHVPWDRVAMTAVDAVFDLIDGRPVDQEIRCPVNLLPGETG